MKQNKLVATDEGTHMDPTTYRVYSTDRGLVAEMLVCGNFARTVPVSVAEKSTAGRLRWFGRRPQKTENV